MILQISSVRVIWKSDFHVAVRSKTVRRVGTIAIGINTAIDRSTIHRVNASSGASRLKLVRVNSSGNMLDLIVVVHFGILIPNLFLRDRWGSCIGSGKSVGRNVHTLKTATSDGATENFEDGSQNNAPFH